MVAYSFKARFEQPIVERTKRQTIRAPRKRHARPDEELQLYRSMRTKSCKLLLRETCLAVEHTEIDVTTGGISWIRVNGLEIDDLDAFARADGFSDIADMSAFWLREHGTGLFEGVLIRW